MIRQAHKKEIPVIIDLVFIILKDMELPLLEKIPETTLKQMMAKAALDPTYRYSPERVTVYEKEGQVIGMAAGYPDTDEPIIDLALHKIMEEAGYPEDYRLFTESEVFPDEWYLDTLVVNEQYRGMSIGKKLLTYLPEVAKNTGNDKIGLSVDVKNPQAKKLYEKMGYQTVGECMIGGHLYEHMQYLFD